tara:strand:- start:10804 stop:10932 length:129 start_codon:yes stop_codon:yes gene_type:complete
LIDGVTECLDFRYPRLARAVERFRGNAVNTIVIRSHVTMDIE